MQLSQLGRIILGNGSSGVDEMRAGSDADYEGLDTLLGEVSARAAAGVIEEGPTVESAE